MAVAVASEAEASKWTPSSPRMSCASARTSMRWLIGAPWYPPTYPTPHCRRALVMARIPSPLNSSPAPRRSYSTSWAKERSAMMHLLSKTPSASTTRLALEIVMSDVAQDLLQDGYEGGVFAFADAPEHGPNDVAHRRPDLVEQRPPIRGEEDLAHAIVVHVGLALHESLRFHGVQRPAHGGLLDHRIDSELID